MSPNDLTSVTSGIWDFHKINGLLSEDKPKKLTIEQRYNRRYPDFENGF